jgi:hypothetical protein
MALLGLPIALGYGGLSSHVWTYVVWTSDPVEYGQVFGAFVAQALITATFGINLIMLAIVTLAWPDYLPQRCRFLWILWLVVLIMMASFLSVLDPTRCPSSPGPLCPLLQVRHKPFWFIVLQVWAAVGLVPLAKMPWVVSTREVRTCKDFRLWLQDLDYIPAIYLVLWFLCSWFSPCFPR